MASVQSLLPEIKSFIDNSSLLLESYNWFLVIVNNVDVVTIFCNYCLGSFYILLLAVTVSIILLLFINIFCCAITFRKVQWTKNKNKLRKDNRSKQRRVTILLPKLHRIRSNFNAWPRCTDLVYTKVFFNRVAKVALLSGDRKSSTDIYNKDVGESREYYATRHSNHSAHQPTDRLFKSHWKY